MKWCVVCGERLRAPCRPDRLTCSGGCRVALHRLGGVPGLFPEVMAVRRAWVRADGKRPIRPDGRAASSTDRGTWCRLADVLVGAGDGFGFMLGGGLGCVDLDGCLGPRGLSGVARWALGRLDGAVFAEVSVSGHGLHVFVDAPESPGVRRPGFEFYSRARFIRTTGRRVPLAVLGLSDGAHAT